MEQKRLERYCDMQAEAMEEVRALCDSGLLDYGSKTASIVIVCKSLLSEIGRLQKERDAAIADLGTNCYGCADWDITWCKMPKLFARKR